MPSWAFGSIAAYALPFAAGVGSSRESVRTAHGDGSRSNDRAGRSRLRHDRAGARGHGEITLRVPGIVAGAVVRAARGAQRIRARGGAGATACQVPPDTDGARARPAGGLGAAGARPATAHVCFTTINDRLRRITRRTRHVAALMHTDRGAKRARALEDALLAGSDAAARNVRDRGANPGRGRPALRRSRRLRHLGSARAHRWGGDSGIDIE